MSRALRHLVSGAWSLASEAARGLADLGWIQPVRLRCRVVSVGNLQAGGAGKTPLVAQVAREAGERGLSVCILIRGYGGSWEKTGGVIEPGSAPADPRACGDEAALLHDLVPQAWIGVGSDRVRQFERVEKAAQRSGQSLGLAVLDDGFQNWRITKDVEIVALTSAQRGEAYFRDFSSALKRAKFAVWTKGEIEPRTGKVPLVKVRYRIAPAPKSSGNFWLVTGLADGGSAKRTAIEAGYRIERHLDFPDHARYPEPLVRGIREQASKAGAQLLMTGKDWVKWRQVDREKPLVFEPEIVFERGREHWVSALWGENG